jgi:nucleotide sugar dehydrogenase
MEMGLGIGDSIMRFGIIGAGVVGKAFGKYHSRFPGNKVNYYDKLPEICTVNSIDELCNQSRIVFICIPTPSCAISDDYDDICRILEKVNHPYRNGYSVVVRSTIVPGTMDGLQKSFPELGLVYYPEFLTERTADKDVAFPGKHVIGYDETNEHSIQCKKRLVALLDRQVSSNPIYAISYLSAELVKMLTNAAYAAKVSLFNELRRIVELYKEDWEEVLHVMLQGSLINANHTRVPGPDGKYGFGGKCLPKDLDALIGIVESRAVVKMNPTPLWILNAVKQRNDLLDRKGEK